MTNKSLAALFFGCILTASAASAQSLLPKPQSFVAGKGAFSTNAKLKVVNEVGAEAENIYSKKFTANTADDARQVVRFTRLDGASSPEAYRSTSLRTRCSSAPLLPTASASLGRP